MLLILRGRLQTIYPVVTSPVEYSTLYTGRSAVKRRRRKWRKDQTAQYPRILAKSNHLVSPVEHGTVFFFPFSKPSPIIWDRLIAVRFVAAPGGHLQHRLGVSRRHQPKRSPIHSGQVISTELLYVDAASSLDWSNSDDSSVG